MVPNSPAARASASSDWTSRPGRSRRRRRSSRAAPARTRSRRRRGTRRRRRCRASMRTRVASAPVADFQVLAPARRREEGVHRAPAPAAPPVDPKVRRSPRCRRCCSCPSARCRIRRPPRARRRGCPGVRGGPRCALRRRCRSRPLRRPLSAARRTTSTSFYDKPRLPSAAQWAHLAAARASSHRDDRGAAPEHPAARVRDRAAGEFLGRLGASASPRGSAMA